MARKRKLFSPAEKLQAAAFVQPATLLTAIASQGAFVAPLLTPDQLKASIPLGYPPAQAELLSTGGTPVDIKQTNGLFNLLSQFIVWLNTGGTWTFDPAVVAVGGYNQGAQLWCASASRYLISLKNNNTANFITTPSYVNDGVNWAFAELPSINDNGAQVTVGKPLNVNGNISATGGISSGGNFSTSLATGGYYLHGASLLPTALNFSSGTNYAAGGAYINGSLTVGDISALQIFNNYGNITSWGTLTVSTNGTQIPHATLAVNGNGDINGYGVVLTTPQGVYAPNGNTTLGNVAMGEAVAHYGISYPNIPNADSYTMGFGWDGSHVRGIVDNNPAATFALANVSDLPTSGGGILRFSTGLVMLYGWHQPTNTAPFVTFPVTVSQVLSVVATPFANQPSITAGQTINILTTSTNGFQADCVDVQNISQPDGFFWQAICQL